MTFKELALKMLKRFPDGIWVHFHDMPDRFRIRNEIYLDEQSLDEFESRLKKEVADYYSYFERGLKNERKNVNFHCNGYTRFFIILDLS